MKKRNEFILLIKTKSEKKYTKTSKTIECVAHRAGDLRRGSKTNPSSPRENTVNDHLITGYWGRGTLFGSKTRSIFFFSSPFFIRVSGPTRGPFKKTSLSLRPSVPASSVRPSIDNIVLCILAVLPTERSQDEAIAQILRETIYGFFFFSV